MFAISITFLDGGSKALNDRIVGGDEGIGKDSIVGLARNGSITNSGCTDRSSSRSPFLTGDDTGSSSLTKASWRLRCWDFGSIKHTRRSEIDFRDCEYVQSGYYSNGAHEGENGRLKSHLGRRGWSEVVFIKE